MFFRRTKNSAFLFLILLSAGSLHAQSSAIGGVSAAWLNLASSARIEGMGDAYVAVADDVDALGVNPGSLGRLTQNQLSLTHNSWVQGASIEQMIGNLNLGKGAGNIAFDFTYGNFGDVERFMISGGLPVSGGTFQPMTWLASCGYGLSLNGDISLGLSGKILIDDLDNNQQIGAAGDVGAVWNPSRSGFTLGFSVLNMGSLSGAAIPTEGRVGIAYGFSFKDPNFMMVDNSDNKLLLSVDGLAPFQDFSAARAAFGAEFWYHDVVALRLGQQIMNAPGLTGLVGFSAGAGLRDGVLQLDYAFATRGDLGNTNMITLLAKL